MSKLKKIQNELKRFSVLPAPAFDAKYKFVLTGIDKRVCEDSYEEGETGNAWYTLNEKLHKECDSIEEVINEVSNYGVHGDLADWVIIDGRLSTNQLEDGDSNMVESNSPLLEKWKKGKITLYSCYYDVFIALMLGDRLIKNPSEEELERACENKIPIY